MLEPRRGRGARLDVGVAGEAGGWSERLFLFVAMAIISGQSLSQSAWRGSAPLAMVDVARSSGSSMRGARHRPVRRCAGTLLERHGLGELNVSRLVAGWSR